jgi:hypothetical protein
LGLLLPREERSADQGDVTDHRDGFLDVSVREEAAQARRQSVGALRNLVWSDASGGARRDAATAAIPEVHRQDADVGKSADRELDGPAQACLQSADPDAQQ